MGVTRCMSERRAALKKRADIGRDGRRTQLGSGSRTPPRNAAALVSYSAARVAFARAFPSASTPSATVAITSSGIAP